MNNVIEKEEQCACAEPTQVETERDYVQPAINVVSVKDGYVLEAELPGVSKEGLNISLEGNVLTIEGRRQALEVSGAELLYRESRPADFRRVLELDPAIETGKIGAKLEQGILTLTLPKAEAAKPRRISVS